MFKLLDISEQVYEGSTPSLKKEGSGQLSQTKSKCKGDKYTLPNNAENGHSGSHKKIIQAIREIGRLVI